MQTYELATEFDSRKSFYGKARVTVEGTMKLLYSYGTHVATIKNGGVVLMDAWDHSATTLRHVKEFLRQGGFEATTKAQIEAAYTGL